MLVTTWEGVFPNGTPVKRSWTSIWPIGLVLGLLVVFWGISPFRVQDGVVAWFFSPLAVGPFQDMTSILLSRSSPCYKVIKSPATAACSIAGAVGTAVRFGIATLVLLSPNLSGSRIYLLAQSPHSPRSECPGRCCHDLHIIRPHYHLHVRVYFRHLHAWFGEGPCYAVVNRKFADWPPSVEACRICRY
ncbi:hypothetical protein F4819DRAFT_384506 [Hypoxylon fuscum]|nr:hypothetical protein F4819DRAFT_384506 [Hypoxylon fuscum]